MFTLFIFSIISLLCGLHLTRAGFMDFQERYYTAEANEHFAFGCLAGMGAMLAIVSFILLVGSAFSI